MTHTAPGVLKWARHVPSGLDVVVAGAEVGSV